MEQIWYKDPVGFLAENNVARFLPSTDMNFVEQLNALLRFSVYFSIIVYILKQDVNVFFVPIFMALFTACIYAVDQKNKVSEDEVLERMGLRRERSNGNRLCAKPTDHNPFMNVLMSDYAENPKRPSACTLSGSTKQEIKKKFDRSLYRDVDDVFHKKASDRQFYTMPSTTIPNDSMSYARWLYQTHPTCKEGNGAQCHANTFRMANL